MCENSEKCMIFKVFQVFIILVRVTGSLVYEECFLTIFLNTNVFLKSINEKEKYQFLTTILIHLLDSADDGVCFL